MYVQTKGDDPKVIVPWRQIVACIALYAEADDDTKESIRRSWHKDLIKYAVAATRWMRVVGPMGATICTLLDMQWKPLHPCRWMPPQQDHYEDFTTHPHISDHRMLHLIERHLRTQLWCNAADDFTRAGFQEGLPDFAATGKAYKQLVKEELFTEAKALEVALVNKSWTARRIRDEEVLVAEADKEKVSAALL